MKPTGFIARRYLFSKKHISLISTLTAISVTGVTIGTALLIVVLSVFNGFFEVIKELLLSNDPDIRVESNEGNTMSYSAEMTAALEGIPEVRLAVPYVEGKALMIYKNREDRVVSIKGIPGTYPKLNNLQKNVTSGTIDLQVRNRKPGMLMSEQLLSELRLDVGDEVVLLSADGMRKSLTQFSLPRTYRFEVRGAYSMVQIVETASVYIDIEAAQRLFNLRNSISGIDVALSNSNRAEALKSTIQAKLRKDLKVSSWYDLQRPLYDVMNLEKWISYFILMLIVLVAVLNIIGSLTMIVIQKNRDIGVLLTMGYTPKQIKQIFIQQGFYIGLIGCTLGGAIGLFLSWLQQQYGLIELSSAFILEAYPVNIELLDVSIVLIGSMLLCIAASWYPSKRASSVQPADAVRYD
ncbi:MAG: ABC transporter permease [Balneolaceae bacterium]|nr:ABC transporter permease [Balneolaceae bacterium]